MMRVESVRHLAYLLGLKASELHDIASRVGLLYKPFVDCSGLKARTIDKPVVELRLLQKKIYQLFLRDYPYSEFALAGVRGRSLRDAIARHQGQPLVVRLDVRDFYPSITDTFVFGIWRRLGHGTKVASILTRLTTYNHRLPQGASTSLALANLHMEPVDRETYATLQAVFPEIQYSRWVDDMVFSGSLDAAVVFEVAAAHLRRAGLRAHRARAKRDVMPSDASQHVLGAVVNVRMSLSRKRRRLTRAIVHTAKKFGGDTNVVRGHIEYLKSFHVSLAEELEDSLRLAQVLFQQKRKSGPGPLADDDQDTPGLPPLQPTRLPTRS